MKENLGRTGACCKVILRWDVALGWVMGEEAKNLEELSSADGREVFEIFEQGTVTISYVL